MRVFLIRITALAAALMLLAGSAVCEEWYIRVIARDDSEAARREKMRTALAALRAMPEKPEELSACLPLVFAAAERESDCRCDVRFWSPDAETPPRPTCYIVIGPGGGHNWWGVLFPDSLRLMGQGENGAGVRFAFPLLSRAMRLLFGVEPCLQGGQMRHEAGADVHGR